jgi:hypothetical protein
METMTTLPSRDEMWAAWDKGQRAREFDELWEAWAAACRSGDKAATKVAAEAHDRAMPYLKAAVKGWLLSRYGYSTEDTTVRVSKVLTRNFGPEMQYYPGPVFALPISEIAWPDDPNRRLHHPDHRYVYLWSKTGVPLRPMSSTR